MPITIEKEWAAIDGEEIVEKSDTKESLLALLHSEDLNPDEYDIVALPKSHSSMYI